MNFLWDNIFKRLGGEHDIRSVLSNNFLFRNLTKRELHFIENIVHVRKYRTGEMVFRQNETGVGMYIIVKGRVEISILDELLPEKDQDRDILVTTLEAGDFFGELSLVEEVSVRSATAVTSDETTLIGFFKSDLLEILDRNPDVGVKIVFRLAEVLGRRLKETTGKISQLKNEIRHVGELQGVVRESRRTSTEKT